MHDPGGRAGPPLETQKRAISLELISAVQASRAGQVEDAVRRQRGAIESCRRLHLRSVEGVLGRVLGAYLHQAGASAEAVALYAELVQLAQELGEAQEEAEICLGQGIALIWTRDAEGASMRFARGTELATATDLRGLVEEGHRLAVQLCTLWATTSNPAHEGMAMSSVSRLAEKFWFRGVSEQSQALNAAEPAPPAARGASGSARGASGSGSAGRADLGEGSRGGEGGPTQQVPAVHLPLDDEEAAGGGFDLSDEVTGVFRPSQMGFFAESEAAKRARASAPKPAAAPAPAPAPASKGAAGPPPLEGFDDLESESTVVHSTLGEPSGRGGR